MDERGMASSGKGQTLANKVMKFRIT